MNGALAGTEHWRCRVGRYWCRQAARRTRNKESRANDPREEYAAQSAQMLIYHCVFALARSMQNELEQV